jgi:hypothetical protein
MIWEIPEDEVKRLRELEAELMRSPALLDRIKGTLISPPFGLDERLADKKSMQILEVLTPEISLDLVDSPDDETLACGIETEFSPPFSGKPAKLCGARAVRLLGGTPVCAAHERPGPWTGPFAHLRWTRSFENAGRIAVDVWSGSNRWFEWTCGLNGCERVAMLETLQDAMAAADAHLAEMLRPLPKRKLIRAKVGSNVFEVRDVEALLDRLSKDGFLLGPRAAIHFTKLVESLS